MIAAPINPAFIAQAGGSSAGGAFRFVSADSPDDFGSVNGHAVVTWQVAGLNGREAQFYVHISHSPAILIPNAGGQHYATGGMISSVDDITSLEIDMTQIHVTGAVSYIGLVEASAIRANGTLEHIMSEHFYFYWG